MNGAGPASQATYPSDAASVVEILKAMARWRPVSESLGLPFDVAPETLAQGVEQCEPRVVGLLLEFLYRHVNDTLRESLEIAEHAGRDGVNSADVRLAIQARAGHSFTTPPPREVRSALALERNRKPLPQMGASAGAAPGQAGSRGPLYRVGLRLPPEPVALIAPNFQIGLGARLHRPTDKAAPKTAPAARPAPTGEGGTAGAAGDGHVGAFSVKSRPAPEPRPPAAGFGPD